MIHFKTLTLALSLFGAASLTAIGAGKPSSKIEWSRQLDKAVAEAAKQNRPVLLRFTAKWCGPCLLMEAQVWPDKKVAQEVNGHFLPVVIDVDGPGAEAIADKYQVEFIPLIVAINPKGREVARASTMETAETLDFLKHAQERAR